MTKYIKPKLPKQVLLVQDQNLAAALFVYGVHAIAMHKDHNGEFFGLFPVTKDVREHVKSYCAGGLAVSEMELEDELAHMEACHEMSARANWSQYQHAQ